MCQGYINREIYQELNITLTIIKTLDVILYSTETWDYYNHFLIENILKIRVTLTIDFIYFIYFLFL